MKNNQNEKSLDILTEPFKKALGETTKAMADSKDLEVSFSSESSDYNDGNARLPQISKKMKGDVAQNNSKRHETVDAVSPPTPGSCSRFSSSCSFSGH